jgi:hypothetical protein
MGCYVNPESEAKESWLNREGKKVNTTCSNNKPENTLPVMLVFNNLFTAAGIAYSEDELNYFLDPSDYRVKLWYYVPLEKLELVSDIKEYL